MAANFSCSLVRIPDLTGLDCSANLLEQVFRRLAKSPILAPLEWMGLPLLVVFSKWTRFEDSSDAISEAELRVFQQRENSWDLADDIVINIKRKEKNERGKKTQEVMTRQDPNKYPEWMTGGSGNLATPRRQL